MINPPSGPSAYISYYSMTREPFGERVEDDLYYPEPLRKQRLEILLHLTQYSTELMLVIGPAGSGKTTLLQQYQEHALDSWSVARIEAGVAPDDRQFLQQLYRQMGLEFRGATQTELAERMEQHFLSLQGNSRQAVMLVDDADKLPVNTLKNILVTARLVNPQGKPLVRVILFGNRELVQNLQNSHLGHHAAIAKRSIELPPFNLEQTANYILHRLSAAQYAASTPFTDAAIAKIHKRSNGWPGLINELSRQLLLDTLPEQPKPRDPILEDMPSSVRPKRIVALLITLAVISSLLIYQEEVNQWFTPGTPSSAKPESASTTLPLALPEQSSTKTTAPLAAEPFIPEPLTPDSLTSTPEAAEPEESSPGSMTASESPGDDMPAEPAADDIPLAETPAVAEATPPSASAPQTVEASPPPHDIAATEAVPATKSTPPGATPTVTASPPPPVAAKPATGDSALADKLPNRQNRWLLSQNPQAFTLQLVAGNNLETLLRFMAEHKLHDNLAVYHSQRDGKPWHGLLYGVYSTKQAAIDARSQLPAALRDAQPWVRDLDGIQQSLTQAP